MSCDCCHRDRPVQVGASPIGPASFAYCQECLAEGAEPEFTILYLWEEVADRDWEGINPERLACMKVFKEGEYISVRSWSEKYG